MSRHTRSVPAAQRREAKNYVMTQGYYDRRIGETTCLTTSNQLADYLKTKYAFVDTSVITRYEKGEVLIDKRGLGSLQR